jgi:peptidoglycan lytic transglycosylase
MMTAPHPIKRVLAVVGLVLLAACAEQAPPPVVAALPPPVLPPAPEQPFFSQIGTASWYGGIHHGRKTANGERFNMNDLTAAHRALKMGTVLRVTNLDNGRVTTVRVNDRGPYVHSRIIDLSAAAAHQLGMKQDGLAHVRIEAFAADQRDGNAVATAPSQ